MTKEKAEKFSHPHKSWIWLMAWRDSRKNKAKLYLFVLSISMGIAALVGITSFRYNLLEEIELQSKELLGADFVVSGNNPAPDSLLFDFKALSSKESVQLSLASMAYFPNSDATRLVQVNALGGDYPYYGKIITEPENAADTFQKQNSALVDEKLMLQYDVRVGDSVRIGNLMYRVSGKLKKIPGQSDVGMSISPVIYVPLEKIWESGLLERGSRVTYQTFFLFHPKIDTTNLFSVYKAKIEKAGYDIDTVEERMQETSRSFSDLAAFLQIIAFAALILGSVGVASSVHVYAKTKIATVAILRCLGMLPNQSVLLFVIQMSFFGFLGALIGSVLGILLQKAFPILAASFLPITFHTSIQWSVVGVGIFAGTLITVLFSLFSLLYLKGISPLAAIRFSEYSTNQVANRDRFFIITLLLIVIYLSLFWLLGDFLQALYQLGILIGALLLLTLWGQLLIYLVRKFLPQRLPFVWRQGLSNLFRPNNQTLVLLLTIGLGTTLLGLVYFVKDMLVAEVTLSAENERPNTVLFDIQTRQRKDIRELTTNYDLPVLQDVPVVTMRLVSINGKTKKDVEADSLLKIPEWAFNREYRVTYRDSLIDSETLTAGSWTGQMAQTSDSIWISMSAGYAENLNVEIGDELVFNVQGALMKTYIGSLREVDWRRVQTNFLVVFPTGVLEKAPQFHVLMTRILKDDLSARYQQAVVRQFPNVSVIDLELILKTVEELLGKVSFVVRFMAFFSVITGFLVLISTIILSRYQRISETVLLRTLGASRRQLWQITFAEYLFLGALGAFSGLILSLILLLLSGKYIFDIFYLPGITETLAIFFSITFTTISIGLLNSRGIIRSSPLEILRSQG